jgi:hypothetical protein
VIPAARYVRVFVATFCAAVACAGGVNLAVDPYGVAQAVEVPWLNGRRPAELAQARLRKPFDLRRRRYDGIALGASQVEFGIDTENPSLVARGIRLYNAGFSEQRPFEQALLLRLAAETAQLKFALISLDFLRYVGGGGRPQFMPRDWTPWQGVASYLRSLASARTLADSAATVVASATSAPTAQHLPGGQLNIDEYFALRPQPHPRIEFDNVDRYYLNSAYGIVMEQRAQLERAGFDHAAVRDMLETARRHRIALHFFVPPGHARQAEIIRALGIERLFRQWLGELACLLAREADWESGAVLWDFTGYNAVTTERIPAASEATRMRWYHDPVHFTSRTGRAIEDRLLGLPSTELANGDDFGAIVTPESIAGHFVRRDESRRRYLAASPGTKREIASLYEGPPTTPGEAAPATFPCAPSRP